jgi:uncharacterized protein YuzE
MRISYDAEADALYIRLLEGRQECRTVKLSDKVALNLGPGEKLVGIELLDAKAVLGPGQTPGVVLEGLERASAAPALQEKPTQPCGSSLGTARGSKWRRRPRSPRRRVHANRPADTL